MILVLLFETFCMKEWTTTPRLNSLQVEKKFKIKVISCTFHEIFQVVEKIIFQIFSKFCFFTFKYVLLRLSTKIKDLEANGSFPGTCLAWALA